MTNAYAPPNSAVELPTPAPVPRPIAIILFQVVGFAALAVAGIGLIFHLLQLFDPLRAKLSHTTVVLVLAVRVALVAAIATMLVLVHRRHRAGRVLGLVFLAVINIPSVLLLFSPQAGPTLARAIGWYSVSIALLSVSLLWAYKFGFSERARRYFASHAA